ncbi:hypothetical protein B0J12DRAFT_741172 [Macrophomina phaseolina]|uniref:Sulfatase N-terminal domain-containing protein n=1 Tax=Macrophomina phaseolina TaxID=35725 RepID=A0ABQ8G905_9PEZI|nr:hypothetical protein B0J12DRAFT_741172 [Macrophomina phaseolina]
MPLMKSFSLMIDPIAPHVAVNVTIGLLSVSYTLSNGSTRPAKRHLGLFSYAKPSDASWVAQLPVFNGANVEQNDGFYSDRLRTAGRRQNDRCVFADLAQHGVLNNTNFVYTSTHGFHISQHLLQPGKKRDYEADVNVPLTVRGADIPIGAGVDVPASHVDLAPAFLDTAGLP